MSDTVDPALEGLEPKLVWEQFDAIRQIPRPSLHEELLRKHLRDLAKQQSWGVRGDAAGNLVLYVPGRGAGVDSLPLAIQGHMDMVCAKDPGVTHDFYRDPIRLHRTQIEIDGQARDVIKAQGTTLGSDNGLGLATALALGLDPSVDHPPLELLFTADEETGMSGAFDLDGGMITAARLLNLDAEEHGSIYLSCAGGRELVGTWDLRREAPRPDDVALRVRLSGLRGGHSGVDIHEGRPNAIVTLLELLSSQQLELDGVRLASCDGGSRPNAIPRNAQAVLWCPPQRAQVLTEQLEAVAKAMREGLLGTDPDACVVIEKVAPEDCPAPLEADQSRALLKALSALHDGVIALSESIEGLVETSNNLGVIASTEASLSVTCMTRSSRDGAIESAQDRMMLTLESAGANVRFEAAYPGWQADLDNPLLVRARVVYERLFGGPPEIKAIHAGLECGILNKRIPGLHMIAFGPEIRNAHTPDEAVVLDTVEPFWRLVSSLVSDLCN